ncbi:MAG: TolC family protein [Alcanivorax sp.]|nr:TolC family protein [Alcanivorax sp.]
MFLHFIRPLAWASLCLLALPAVAAPSADWSQWLRQQIQQHPEVRAAQQRLEAAYASAEDTARPLYNPELSTSYEREGRQDNYQIGLSQTVDIHGRRNALQQQAGFSRAAAEQAYALTLQEKTAALLQALIRQQEARERSDMATEQEQRLERLIDLIGERQRAGDLGRVDAELAYISLARGLGDTARAQAELRQAEARLNELLSDMPAGNPAVPEAFWRYRVDTAGVDVDRHPAVAAALADWQAQRRQADLGERSRRADPTIGLRAGRTGEEDVIGLDLSVPLNLRNNYSARARAAGRQALAAEARYQSVRRRQLYAVQGLGAALEEYRQRHERWRALVGQRLTDSARLLGEQWRRGDLGTPDYLQALQQHAEGLQAGIALRSAFRETHIEWLLQSGHLDSALDAL